MATARAVKGLGARAEGGKRRSDARHAVAAVVWWAKVGRGKVRIRTCGDAGDEGKKRLAAVTGREKEAKKDEGGDVQTNGQRYE